MALSTFFLAISLNKVNLLYKKIDNEKIDDIKTELETSEIKTRSSADLKVTKLMNEYDGLVCRIKSDKRYLKFSCTYKGESFEVNRLYN